MLASRGVDPKDITVLTDSLPEAPEFPKINGAPVYANIINGFDALARDSTAGDDVVFYYSGHGTRQPTGPDEEKDEPEPDGYDEVLLPADSGPYDPTGGGIKHSLVDYRLGKKLDAIRKEAEGLAVGRPEWADCAFGAWQRSRRCRVQVANPKASGTIAECGESNSSPVRRQCE